MSTRLASFVLAAAAAAIGSVALADAPQPAAPVQLTAEDAAAFLDGLLPTSMTIGDVAGATVSIVKDDALLLAFNRPTQRAEAE